MKVAPNRASVIGKIGGLTAHDGSTKDERGLHEAGRSNATRLGSSSA